MKLSYEEQHSSLFAKLKLHLESRLTILRARNDSVTLNPEQTSTLRGQIKELKILLELGNTDTGATLED